MHSTLPTETIPAWRAAGLPYYAFNFYLKRKYGARVQKVSIDAGFTCPNVDGTVAIGGCTFCDNRSFSPSRRAPRLSVTEQINDGIRRLKRRYDCDKFIAYFQPATNTYAPVDRLRALWEEAISHPKVVAMAIGTRPDCVPDEVLDLLQEMGQRTNLTVEYGMQTMHDRSLDWMNRGHHHDAMVDAMNRTRGRGFEVCAHLILGLPGESHADMLASADEVVRLQVDSVKIHNLYAVRKTKLAEQVEQGEVTLIGRDDYIRTLTDVIERLPPTMIVERISGEAPPDYFVGPAWCLDKPLVKLAFHAELEKRKTYQGSNWPPSVVK